MQSLCNVQITDLLYSVKRSDVTLWKESYIAHPPLYFILWNAVTSLVENKVI